MAISALGVNRPLASAMVLFATVLPRPAHGTRFQQDAFKKSA